MAKYKLHKDGVIDLERSSENIKVYIPNNLGNKDWQAYQKWLDIEGNVPEPKFTEDEKAVLEQIEKDRITEQQIKDKMRALAIQALAEEAKTI
jgi:hypothetical protein